MGNIVVHAAYKNMYSAIKMTVKGLKSEAL